MDGIVKWISVLVINDRERLEKPRRGASALSTIYFSVSSKENFCDRKTWSSRIVSRAFQFGLSRTICSSQSYTFPSVLSIFRQSATAFRKSFEWKVACIYPDEFSSPMKCQVISRWMAVFRPNSQAHWLDWDKYQNNFFLPPLFVFLQINFHSPFFNRRNLFNKFIAL